MDRRANAYSPKKSGCQNRSPPLVDIIFILIYVNLRSHYGIIASEWGREGS